MLESVEDLLEGHRGAGFLGLGLPDVPVGPRPEFLEDLVFLEDVGFNFFVVLHSLF